MNQLKYAFFLIVSIVGNPFYQMIAYIICSELDFRSAKGTNVHQVNLFVFIIILVLIFLVRLLIYASIFTSKKQPFSVNGNNSFLYIFSERHLYLAIGFFTFLIWTSPLEGNIVGFFIFPFTVLFGSVLSVITFIRLLKTKKIWIAKNKNH